MFLIHFDAKRQIKLETDTSDYTISGILSQKQNSKWKIMAYYSWKMNGSEKKNELYDSELFVIVESFCYWH